MNAKTNRESVDCVLTMPLDFASRSRRLGTSTMPLDRHWSRSRRPGVGDDAESSSRMHGVNASMAIKKRHEW